MSDFQLIELRDNNDNNDTQTNANNNNTNEHIVVKTDSSRRSTIIIAVLLLIIILLTIGLIISVSNSSSKNDEKENNSTDEKKDEKEIIDDKIPAIFDVDEGGDDMIAYILANNSKKFNILGITTVSPAYTIDNVTDIWLRFLEYMNFDAKVYKGENHPLKRQSQPEKFYHDYQLEFPQTNKKLESQSAVDFMVETIKNYKKKVTLFLLAPLTNFAKAYQKDPSIINNIEDIIIMGGTKQEGNMPLNPKAEYNIYCDADAANIVFNCGKIIKVLGTDVTHKTEFSDFIYEKYLAYNTRSSFFTYCVMKGTFVTWNDNYVHDPITVIYYLNNDIVTLKKYHAYVNTTNPDVNGTDYGTVHFIEPNNTLKYNIEYSESIDIGLYWHYFDKLVLQY